MFSDTAFCKDCRSTYFTNNRHECDPKRLEQVREATARKEVEHLETEIEVWTTKTNEGRFAVWYAEHRRFK